MSTTVTSPETAPPTTGEVHRALADRTVHRAVWRAVRDERPRGDGMRARDAIDRLIGPHRDADGRVYSHSDERGRARLSQARPAPRRVDGSARVVRRGRVWRNRGDRLCDEDTISDND